jgi:HlyD family secretion protein
LATKVWCLRRRAVRVETLADATLHPRGRIRTLRIPALSLALFFAVPTILVAGNLVPRPAPARFLTAPVVTGDITSTLKVTGSLQAVVTARVGSQLSGQIDELFVDFNDHVTRGQIMARLDSRIYESRVRSAEAMLAVANAKVQMARAAVAKAEADVERVRDALAVTAARVESVRVKADNLKSTWERKRVLGDRGVLGQSQIEDAGAAFESAAADLQGAQSERLSATGAIKATDALASMAKADFVLAEAMVKRAAAELEQAQTDLERTEIRATTDGVVIGRDVGIGQTVAATLEAPTLFFIAQDLRKMEVHANIDQADIGRIRLGQAAKFMVDAYPGQLFEAKVSQIRKAPVVVQNVVTYTVILSAANPDSILLPGMTAVAQITIHEAKNVLKVPNAALRYRPPQDVAASRMAISPDAVDVQSGSIVWVLEEDQLTPQTVILGHSDSLATAVINGELSAGQKVIVGNAPSMSKTWISFERWGL